MSQGRGPPAATLWRGATQQILGAAEAVRQFQAGRVAQQLFEALPVVAVVLDDDGS